MIPSHFRTPQGYDGNIKLGLVCTTNLNSKLFCDDETLSFLQQSYTISAE